MNVQPEVGDIIWSKISPSEHKWVVISVEPYVSMPNYQETWEVGLPYGVSDVVIQSLLNGSKHTISALIEVPNTWAVKRNGKVIQ